MPCCLKAIPDVYGFKWRPTLDNTQKTSPGGVFWKWLYLILQAGKAEGQWYSGLERQGWAGRSMTHTCTAVTFCAEKKGYMWDGKGSGWPRRL